MISTERAIKILTEHPPEEQVKLIDKLTEADAKYLLKIAMKVIRGEDVTA